MTGFCTVRSAHGPNMVRKRKGERVFGAHHFAGLHFRSQPADRRIGIYEIGLA